MTDAYWEMRTRGVSGRAAAEIGELLSLEYPNESAEWLLGDRAVSEAEEEAAVRRTATWTQRPASAVPRPDQASEGKEGRVAEVGESVPNARAVGRPAPGSGGVTRRPP